MIKYKIFRVKFFITIFIITLFFCFYLKILKNGEIKAANNLKKVEPIIETEPVHLWGDNADDIAIWLDERNKAKSLIIGTEKKEGLAVYDLQGRILQFIKSGKFNNVDIRYNFPLENKLIDVVAASNRSDNSITLFGVDRDRGSLFELGARHIRSKLEMVYGLCMYHNKRNKSFYVFVTSKDGKIEEWKLVSTKNGIDGIFIRNFHLASQLEGCVADDDRGVLFVGEEEFGVWGFPIDKDDGQIKPFLIDRVGNGHLFADVEGITLYTAADKQGYLIVSSQGSSSFAIYNRRKPYNYIGSFAVVNNKRLNIDEVTGTDGIDIINVALNKNFNYGLFVAQDDENRNPRAHQNFKLIPWESIAKKFNLIIENHYISWK
jgi:3-phytase